MTLERPHLGARDGGGEGLRRAPGPLRALGADAAAASAPRARRARAMASAKARSARSSRGTVCAASTRARQAGRALHGVDLRVGVAAHVAHELAHGQVALAHLRHAPRSDRSRPASANARRPSAARRGPERGQVTEARRGAGGHRARHRSGRTGALRGRPRARPPTTSLELALDGVRERRRRTESPRPRRSTLQVSKRSWRCGRHQSRRSSAPDPAPYTITSGIPAPLTSQATRTPSGLVTWRSRGASLHAAGAGPEPASGRPRTARRGHEALRVVHVGRDRERLGVAALHQQRVQEAPVGAARRRRAARP